MPFDAFVLNAVADEIKEKLVKTGRRVHKIFQINQELIITFRGEDRSLSLFFSVHPQNFRIHFTGRHYTNPPSPPAFCMLLRKHLIGGVLISLEQPPLERILYLNFSAPNREGKEVIKTLVLEMMGKHSNLILLDTASAENKRNILGAIKPVSPLVNRRRTILPHCNYFPPPLQDKFHPFALNYEAFASEMIRFEGQDAKSALINNIQGISPFLAGEIVARAEAMYISKETVRPLWNALEKLLNIYSDKRWEPTLIYTKEGTPADFSAFKPVQFFEGSFRFVPSISMLLDEFYQFREKSEGKKNLLQLLNQHLEQALKKCRHKEKVQLRELEEAKKADQLRLCGELILLHLKNIPPKTAEIFLENLFQDGEKIKISLDPGISPASNAQRYFKKYRKARQGEKKISERLSQTRQEIAYIESVLFSMEKADLPTLQEIKEELEEAGLLRKKMSPLQKKTTHFNPLRYYSSLGEEIIIGRNNRQNEYLVHKVAAKTDFWLHVKDMPGAHVIIKSNNPSAETIAEAALLAAYHSKGAGSSNVAVDYTQVKNIKRHPAGRPGMVIYTNYKTIFVTPKEQLIRKLLDKH